LRSALRKLFLIKSLRRVSSIFALALLDAFAFGAGVGVLVLWRGEGIGNLAPLLLAAWICVFAAHRLYDRALVRRTAGMLVRAAFVWAGLAAGGALLYPGSGVSAGEMVLAAAGALLVAGILRALYERGVETIYRSGFGQTPTVVVGSEEDRARMRRMMQLAPGAYSLAGEVDTGEGDAPQHLARLREVLDGSGARGVILAGAERLPDEELLELLRSVRLRRVRMRVVPGALALMRNQPVFSQTTGLPLLDIRYPQLDNYQRALKRLLDVAGAVGGLMLLSPLLLAVAVAIRLDSEGPVFFRQKRVGADAKVFLCYMFRSMYRDAEGRQEEVEGMNEADGPVFKIRDDPRVTRVGRFIRRWSIDELPQLYNVLRGEMSLVGPRPLPVRDFQRMGEGHKRRLSAVPGMTGYWQISGRSNLSFEEMIQLDLYYIENWSLSFDVSIILRTIGAVLRREGAY
jgi:exopolysaccharide biosynthesis polyprenyl glycosylphosphotransferase